MRFEFAYAKSSRVSGDAGSTEMSFSPDTKREPTFFRGNLRPDRHRSLAFREAISALHDVVISDLRQKPKDRSEYLAWLEQQEELDWAAIGEQRGSVAEEIKALTHELSQLRQRSAGRMREFYSARQRYFDYLYTRDYDAWFVLDPVITIHPDELFFECFSQDESTYGRLGTSYEVYQSIGEYACGTTNVDYSQALYEEFQKVRSYKTTALEVDPSGFSVETTAEATYKEVKIDLPDSWVRGFLQVSSAMSLPATVVELHPMDIHNLCFLLRRKRELKGPRSLRYLLEPGKPVRMILEPWNDEIVCGRSIYKGERADEIRVWGRRRLHVLERLIPIAERFVVHLLGSGLPSFYVADLGEMSFTLGLSGWTANDWSTSGNFDLMAPRAAVDHMTQQRVFAGLKESWAEKPDALAQRLGLDRATVLGALSAYTQAGRAIYDINKNMYRVRELTQEPLPLEDLRFANDREAAAARYVEQNNVRVTARELPGGALELVGNVAEGRRGYQPQLTIDSDQRIITASCSCNYYQQNKLYKGPCEHMLALRKAHGEKRRSFWNIFR